MNQKFTIKHVKKQEILTNLTAGFAAFPAMGEDWEYKQSDHFFYYRYKKKVIYEAVQQRPAITQYLMGEGHPAPAQIQQNR